MSIVTNMMLNALRNGSIMRLRTKMSTRVLRVLVEWECWNDHAATPNGSLVAGRFINVAMTRGVCWESGATRCLTCVLRCSAPCAHRSSGILGLCIRRR